MECEVSFSLKKSECLCQHIPYSHSSTVQRGRWRCGPSISMLQERWRSSQSHSHSSLSICTEFMTKLFMTANDQFNDQFLPNAISNFHVSHMLTIHSFSVFVDNRSNDHVGNRSNSMQLQYNRCLETRVKLASLITWRTGIFLT